MGVQKQGSSTSDGLALLLEEDGHKNSVIRSNSQEAQHGAVLSYLLDVAEPHHSFTDPDGATDFLAVNAALDSRLESFQAASSAETLEAQHSGRHSCASAVGSEVMLDTASASGEVQTLGTNLTLLSLSNFSSVRASTSVSRGKWMWEATLFTGGIQQIGWATAACPFTNEEGVGDAPDSYAWDGKRVQRWSVSHVPYGSPWAAGDVIGACLDLDGPSGRLSFYRNGASQGVAFANIRRGPRLAYFPAISLSSGEQCDLNFGARPFRHPVAGFRPLQDPPPRPQLRSADYLVACLQRLAGVLAGQGQGQGGAGRVAEEERVALVDALMQRLAPLLTPYTTAAHIVPTLLKVFHEEPPHDQETLEQAVGLLHLTMEEHEFGPCFRAALQQLALAARSASLIPQHFPASDAYSHIALASALLRIEALQGVWRECPGFYDIMEGFLVLKQPSSRDLAALLPFCWWPGAGAHQADNRISRDRSRSGFDALAAAVSHISDAQLQLCQVMASISCDESQSQGQPLSNLFLTFLEHLVEKNRGATRAVPPPGLSEGSVLVTVYFILLKMLCPYLQTPSASATGGLSEFPVADIFLKGVRQGEADRYWDEPRLGGLLGHVMKQSPPDDLDVSPVQVPLAASPTAAQPPAASHPEPPEPAGGGLRPGVAVALMDRLILVYHLGMAAMFRLAHQQLSAQRQGIRQLSDIEQRLRDATTQGEYVRHLREAQQVFRDDMVTSVRYTSWFRLWLLQPWQQAATFAACGYVVRLLLAVSQRGPLLCYVPEFYVETLVDAYRGPHGRASSEEGEGEGQGQDVRVEGRGLQDIVTFLTRHFDDRRILNPDVRDTLLHSISELLQEGIAAFEGNEAAQAELMPALLAAFDSGRAWASIAAILLRLTTGHGFAQAGGEGGAPVSEVFQERLAAACTSHPAAFQAFMNRLFDTLNWTATDFVVVLKELLEGQHRTRIPEQQSQRRCGLMFELTITMLRLLEWLAQRRPAAFLAGPPLNLARTTELLGFVFSHLAGEAALLLQPAAATSLQAMDNVSRPALLAPLVGIVANLWTAERDSLPGGGFMHSLLHSVAASSACPLEAFDFIWSIDWRSCKNIPPSADISAMDAFRSFAVQLKAVRSAAEEGPAEGAEVPEEFLDPLVMTVMRDPVLLPDSRVTLDRATIERHLLSSQTDPFNRSPLTADMLLPNTALKARIREWQAQHADAQ